MGKFHDAVSMLNLTYDKVTWQNIEGLEDSDLEGTGRRYALATQRLKSCLGLPTEFILPRINIPFSDKLPKSMVDVELTFKQKPLIAESLSKRHWGYYFYLGGGFSTMDNHPMAKAIGRSATILRMNMINDVIEKLFLGSVQQSTVLDFASNWGGMALDMGARGFKSVVGFDFKKENVQKANNLRDYLGLENVIFEEQNVYNLPEKYNSGFDIVYNLGLLYHVTDPVKLAQITYDLTNKVAVFDTLAHKEPFSGYIQAYISEEGIKRPGMGEQQIELHPTYRGLIDLIKFAGFKNLIEVAPLISNDSPINLKDPYIQGIRRTILAFK